MGAVTPQLVVELETRIQAVSESEYSRMVKNLWWRSVAKVRPSSTLKEIVTWLLSTAQIKDQGKGGNAAYDDLVSAYTSYENKVSGANLELSRFQLEDLHGGTIGGEAFDLAGQWGSDIGYYAAYWPQKQVAYFLKNAHTAALFTGYDAVAFFATNHPVHPYDSSKGNYANLITGASAAASGNTPAYPGALPIDESVSVDVALSNLGKLRAYIASIRMPNGEDPRFLRPVGMLCSPKLMPRAVQLANARMIAQLASSGTGTGDVEALVKFLSFATPIEVDELGGFESDTTYFVVCEQAQTSQVGAVIYSEREPFKINYYGVLDQVELARKQKYEWQCQGRNVVAPGHPYLLLKCKGS